MIVVDVFLGGGVGGIDLMVWWLWVVGGRLGGGIGFCNFIIIQLEFIIK